MEINLNKSAENFRISLEKKGVSKMPEMEMAVLMDISFSFKDEHEDGITNALLTRLVPWGLTFDPDKKVDLFTFSDGEKNAKLVGSIDEKNYPNYIPNHVIGKVPGYGGGTHYHHVLEKAFRHFGWDADLGRNGFFGKLIKPFIGKTSEKRRAILFFVTDGEATDNAETYQVVRAASDKGYKVFLVLIGVSNQNVDFRFLSDLDRTCKNATFHEIKNIRDFVKKSDDEINSFFLRDKLVSWLKN